MRGKLKNAGIRKKLVCYSYAIITPILMLISTCLFVRNYHRTMAEERELCQKDVENLSGNLDTLLDGMVEFGTYICINNDILAILSSDDAQALNRDSQLWVHEAPMRTLQDMIALSGQIKTLAIYPENGVNPYLRCADAAAYISSIEEIRQTACYRNAVEKRGKYSFVRVRKSASDFYQANRTDKLVLYREIYDRAKRERLGYLAIGASTEKYIQLCEKSLSADTAGIVVMNESGEELIRTGALPAEVYAFAYGKEPEGGGKGYEVYRCTSEKTGITVCEIVAREGVVERLDQIALVPAALLFGFLIGLYPILAIVSNIVSKPLKELGVAMKRFEKGDFEQKVAVTTGGEVGEVAAGFNQMVDAIKKLIDTNYVMTLQEKESELRALQAQINPHFLYNTLDALYWRATNEGNDEIAEDILSLSQLFRHVLGQGNAQTDIGNEKELLEEYLHIQKMRFSDHLDYEIHMEEAILSHMIPKLILQPFVENAVVHGFERDGGDCLIRVDGKREGEWIVFTVEDNGVGMSEEQLQDIWEVPDAKRYAGQRIGRYAIRNVKERLELLYGDGCTLRIESAVGRGTCVTIRIPWEDNNYREHVEEKRE